MVKGYKAFNKDWTCHGFQYEVGKTYVMNGDIEMCKRGFHFCENMKDCYWFYSFSEDTRIAEVRAEGEVKKDGIKCVTDKITIIREIMWDEVLKSRNEGKGNIGCWNTGDNNRGDYNAGNNNTGDCNSGEWNLGFMNTGRHNRGSKNSGSFNSGEYNAGNWNIGDYNTGYFNTGRCNTGRCNTGGWNIGDYNTGYFNTGYFNTGRCNTGRCNTGNWNIGDWYNIGFFNTDEPKFMMFNKPCDLDIYKWQQSKAYKLLLQMPKHTMEWVDEEYMSDDEKKAHPTSVTTRGYLKVRDKSKCAQFWWDDLDEDNRNVIKGIPNFDADIFYECTGIRV